MTPVRRGRHGAALGAALLAAALATAAHGATPAPPRPVRHLVTFVVDVPATTPPGAAIFVSGSDPALGDWLPGGLRLTSLGGGRHAATARFEHGARIHYRITRGSRETAERDARGGEIHHREYDVTADDTIRVTVAGWSDQAPEPAPRASRLTGDVRLHRDVGSRYVRPRDVRVWLPPGYADSATARYPVLYVHDGQDALDAAASFTGVEWGLDEVATRLIRDGSLAPFIAVCVTSTADRRAEYAPAAGAPDPYARFLIEELRPFVERTYRTRPGPAGTAILGAGLGGAAALRLTLAHPGVFGHSASLSMPARSAETLVARIPRPVAGVRAWVDAGSEEGGSAVERERTAQAVHALGAALAQAGLREGTDLHIEIVAGGVAAERDWNVRLDRVLTFLFGPPGRTPRGGD